MRPMVYVVVELSMKNFARVTYCRMCWRRLGHRGTAPGAPRRLELSDELAGRPGHPQRERRD